MRSSDQTVNGRPHTCRICRTFDPHPCMPQIDVNRSRRTASVHGSRCVRSRLDGFGDLDGKECGRLALELPLAVQLPPLENLVALTPCACATRATDIPGFNVSSTIMDTSGFYVVMSRASSTHTPQIEPDRLASLMYLVYIMGVVNGFDVYCGYSDLVGIPLHAAGATATACGWAGTLRRFTFQRFQPSTGGRRPRPRYLSTPVLEPVLISELDQLFEADIIGQFLSRTRYDTAFITRPPYAVHWGDREAALHHWEALGSRINEIEPMTVVDALSEVSDWIDTAETIRNEAALLGVQFEPPTGDHLDMWRRAIDRFRDMTELT